MNRYLNREILFFGGKGGVGKTTSASAFALGASDRNKRVLLVSTDPAHSIGDIFGISLKPGELKKITSRLTIVEIDPQMEVNKYIEQVKQNLKSVVHKPDMKMEIDKQLQLAKASPGADEAALFDRIVEMILDEREEYDLIVFDTAPTGHTLRLLSLPELMEL